MNSSINLQSTLDTRGGFMQKTVVIGAGPVGALAALYAARRGDLVEVYELRNDLRDPSSVPLNFTKSINLALSERGVNSIRQANCSGLLRSIIADTIPMYGRMIHGEENGRLFEQPQAYDVGGRVSDAPTKCRIVNGANHPSKAICAADRGGLNKRLLDELEQMPNVKLRFNHKLTGADFKKNLAWFERLNLKEDGSHGRAEEIEVGYDFMIGADGAHSATRFHLMKFARVSFQQEYIDTLWCEFHIQPSIGNESDAGPDGFRISPNHLHIWPAGSSMFIAIPSTDKSFTCTLFMSESEFDAVDADIDRLLPLFERNFPGVAPSLISPEDLKAQYKENPHLPLISIKCDPYHYRSSVVIVGDAAHAMVPFYGQGMNAGLEDVRVLYEILDKHNPPLHRSRHSFTSEGRTMGRASALQEYSFVRRKDAHTINDLAMGNYQEMCSDVNSKLYLLRKSVEELLSVWIPALGFKTQYSRVSFSNERYSEVLSNVYWQHAALNTAGSIVLAAAGGIAASALWRWRQR